MPQNPVPAIIARPELTTSTRGRYLKRLAGRHSLLLIKILMAAGLVSGNFSPSLGQQSDTLATPFSLDVEQVWLEQVLPSAETFGKQQGDPPVWPGYRFNALTRARELAGYAFLSKDVPPEEPGYSAPIDMLIGVDTEHQISGLKILNYEETYLRIKGDFLADRAILSQFSNKSLSDEFRIGRDFDGLAGSTVTLFAIARGAREAARRIASNYLDYNPVDPIQAARAQRVTEIIQRYELSDMLDNGLVQQLDVTLPDQETLQLSFTYLTDSALGQYWVGKDNFRAAERAARINPLGGELLLVAVAGTGAEQFQYYQLQVRQAEDNSLSFFRRFTTDSYLPLTVTANATPVIAQLWGAIVLPANIDLNKPFTLAYRPLGSSERSTLDFQLSGLPLDLANGESLLSPTEIEAILEAESGWLKPFFADPPWGETPWQKLGLLLLILTACMTAFFTKRTSIRWLTLLLTFSYLGFIDGGFVSVSHLVNTIKLGPAFLLNNLPLLILSGFTVLTTLLWGRLFCSSLCPFGALQDFITQFGPSRWRLPVPQVIHDNAIYLKYLILLMILTGAVVAEQVSFFQYFEPFGTLFFLDGTVAMFAILIGFLAACFVVPRFYCRYACPLGAALGFVALVSPWRIRRVPQCEVCIVCELECPTGAIRRQEIDFKECVRCDLCDVKLIKQAGTCRHDIAHVIASTNKASLGDRGLGSA
ncbi:MAG: 4Fe-4S binding protein [Gammaproteobacteria bacterium]